MQISVVNGELSEFFAVRDRAVQYGDGVFETLPIIDGQPQHWDRHLARLKLGCQRLNFPPPAAEQLFDDLLKLPLDNERAVLKIIVSRGAGGRGYRPAAISQPTRILTLWPWPQYPSHYFEEGITLRVCDTPLGSNPRLAGIKHLNRLEQVMARGEWDDGEIAEGLMLDQRGNIIEGTMSNVFLLQDGVLHTPLLNEAGVAGIMRQIVIEQCEAIGSPVVEREITLDELGRTVNHSHQQSDWTVACVKELRVMTTTRTLSTPQATPMLRTQLGSALPSHA
ncbi:MAG: aminodeoxychorismate lyase [Gammaproteobacteria bacterium]